jgi:DNA replication licensing factor MCM2
MDYISQDGVAQYFEREFKSFLTSFTDEEGVAVYAERIKAMCESNGESLDVSYLHLSKTKPTLGYVVSNAPAEALRIFDRVAMDVTLDIFAHYDEIRQEIHVRISELPYPENLRDLR